jgi:Na+/H+-translocating membrane pyrophosphatase
MIAAILSLTLLGVALGFAASKITQYFTSTETEPVREIAKAARTGPARTGPAAGKVDVMTLT